ncbi:MAG: hypothetical protein WCO42_01110 [bacterium]
MITKTQVKLLTRTVLMAALFALCAGIASATPQLGLDNFDNGEVNGWLSDTYTDYGRVTDPGLPGVVTEDGNSYYKLSFSPTAEPSQQYGWIYNSSPNYQGDYSNLGLSFDFWSLPAPPHVALSVYFIGNGVNWHQSFVVPTGVWTPVAVNFSSGWSGGVDFLGDVMHVTEIGVMVNHLNDANGSTFAYGLDNWSLQVPEPETYALILMVLISLGLIFRGSIMGFVRQRLA